LTGKQKIHVFVTAQTAIYHCTIASYHCTFCVSLHTILCPGFTHFSLIRRPYSGEPIRISRCNLPCRNWRDGATVWWKFHNHNISRFYMIHPCDIYYGQADGRAWAIAYSAL